MHREVLVGKSCNHCLRVLLQVGAELAEFAGVQPGRQLILIEATIFYCRENATVPSPQCEEQVLLAVLDQVRQSGDTKQQWQAAGEVDRGACRSGLLQRNLARTWQGSTSTFKWSCAYTSASYVLFE